MASFRAYTVQEVRDAAQAYGLDPDFVEAVYATESARGTNPKALTARSVKRKRDTTIVRGPFQLSDEAASDVIRENRLGNVDVNDPDVHLDLALRLMRKLVNMYDGDYTKAAQAYFAGPGGVGTNRADETGTTTPAYSNRIIAEMNKLKGNVAPEMPAQMPMTADMMDSLLLPEIMSNTPFSHGASLEPDMFGMDMSVAAAPAPRGNQMFGAGVSWADLVRANTRQNEFSLPGNMASDMMYAGDMDLTKVLEQIYDDEMAGKEFVNAPA